MVEQYPAPFSIDFEAAGSDEKTKAAWLNRDFVELVYVAFSISRGEQEAKFRVYVDKAKSSPENYVREAMHQLHLDFVQLAEQTAEWRLPDDEQNPA